MNRKSLILKKAVGLVLALAVCLSSVGASAAYVEYKKDNVPLMGPIPGTFTVSTTSDDETAKLITAVYDDKTGVLIDAKVSSRGTDLSNTVNKDTLDGYTVKSYIWGGDGGVKPLEDAQETNIALRAEYTYGRTILVWSELAPKAETASYSILKNGTSIETVNTPDTSYVAEEAYADANYRIVAKDASGNVTGISPEIAIVKVADGTYSVKEETYTFDVDNITYEDDASDPKKSRAYGSADRQIAIGGHGTMKWNSGYSNPKRDYDSAKELGDGQWGTDTQGEKTVIYTDAFRDLTKEDKPGKNGNLYLILGDAFDNNDYSGITMTFDIYNNDSNKYAITYTVGDKTYKTVEKQKDNSKTYTTVSIDFESPYFTANKNTGLFDGKSEIRFESCGKYLGIRNIKITKTPLYMAKFVAADTNTVTSDDDYTYRSSGDSQITVVGAASDYTVETKDGKTALVIPKKNVGFALGGAIKKTDKNLTFVVEYFDTDKAAGLDYVKNDAASSNTATKWIGGEGHNAWKQKAVSVTDANFNGATATGLVDGKCDFRVRNGENTPYYIHSVRVIPTARLNEALAYEVRSNALLYSDGVSFNVESTPKSSGLVLYQPMKDGTAVTSGKYYSTVQEIGGIDAISTTSYKYSNSTFDYDTTLQFEVDHNYISGKTDSKVLIEIDYYNHNNRPMIIQYKDSENNVKTKPVTALTASNEWKTARVVLNDALFTGQMENNTDFWLSLAGTREYNDEKLAQEQLVVKAVRVKNVADFQQTENAEDMTIYIIGDSCAAEWESKFRSTLESNVSVINYAKDDLTIEGFSFAEIQNNLYKNDYVLINFTQGDKSKLEALVSSVLSNQAIPVIISAEADDLYSNANSVATEMNVPFVKLSGADAEARATAIVTSLKNDTKIRVLKDYIK